MSRAAKNKVFFFRRWAENGSGRSCGACGKG